MAEILPPPLEPAAPVVSISISRGDQFYGLVLGMNAKFGDIVGDYGLAYVMDTDLAIVFGREDLGEPKKLGATTAQLNDGKFVGTVSRFGQELLRVEAVVLGPASEPIVGDALDNFQYLAKVPGDDFLPWAFFKHDDYRLTMSID